MDEDQINALAREYAEEGAEEVGLPNCLQNETFGLVVTETECVIKWLLRRYCLVEKGVVRKEYKDARRDAREGYRAKLGTMIAVSEARKALLESLFPDLVKEVE